MTDREAVYTFGLGVLDLDPLDPRRRRATSHPVDQKSDVLLLARQMRFDRTVSAIANPSPDAQLIRLFAGPGAEEDPLHPAA